MADTIGGSQVADWSPFILFLFTFVLPPVPTRTPIRPQSKGAPQLQRRIGSFAGCGVVEDIPLSPPSPPRPTINNNTTHLNHNHGSSPFRFDELRSPFRFADDPGPLPPGALVGRLGDSLIPKGDPMEARLQEMLRYNMDRYATQALDTLHISRRVRELLSVHNIGQRLFAKYVLGLSQGTVSELLSKPKPWDKLTEKGRDSYRKMHAWACDDGAVMLLKSLIPKKGKRPAVGLFRNSR